MKMLRWIAAATLACGAAAAQTQTALPSQLRDVGIDQRLNEPLPLDAVFHDETGRTVKLGEYFGKKPVIFALVYYRCPMLCTLILNGMVRAMRPLSLNPGADFEIVTVSFDPAEGPAVAAAKKKEYVARYARDGAEQHWHFLTGDPVNDGVFSL